MACLSHIMTTTGIQKNFAMCCLPRLDGLKSSSRVQSGAEQHHCVAWPKPNIDAGGEFTRHEIGEPRSGSSASGQRRSVCPGCDSQEVDCDGCDDMLQAGFDKTPIA